MAEQEQNPSESATPYKLEQARKRGSVSRSPEITTVAIMLWVAASTLFMGHILVRNSLDISSQLFNQAGRLSFAETQVGHWFPGVIRDGAMLIIPFLLGTVIVGILINFIQSGPVFTTYPLKPDFNRINPIAGFKKILTVRIFVEAFKTTLKAVLMGTVLYFFILGILPLVTRMFQAEIVQYPAFLIDKSSGLLFRLVAILAVIALLDLIYTRWDFAKRMRMSRREVRDEHKQREGDPRIRQKIRELQREMLKRASGLGKVKDADVLITNPRRLAIALQYKRGEMAAPRIVAKGAGELADHIRSMARRHRIPIVENRKLARALFRDSGIEQPLKEKYFSEVARILVWAETLRKQRNASALEVTA
ncbi:flagellar biosynthesis protein FlhB [Polaromonas sp. A23]|uniref:EscU/YscU/HrcU family type III secretion system export apparatus switch protein n=1 Tax=Polaromonas sp. A23 TaxID=1944133 RepID=UPI0009866C59|nr:EscU/YscU/HrcU family type III secretion system export apparatus switch protein [Polaromonas sp. A23]OOG44453.1 hypothetical protein B0B52_06835 [Polaromonas sp. A23]